MVSFAQAAGSQFVLLLVSVPWWVRLALGFVQASWWEGLVPVYWWVKQDLVLLVHKAVSKGVFKGFEQLVCWWVALCSYCDDCLTWGVPALEPAGIWVRPGIGVKLVTTNRLHPDQYSLLPRLPVSLSLQWALVPQETLLRSTVRSNTGSYRLTDFFWFPLHVTVCVHSIRVMFLFSLVLWSSYTQAQLAFKAKCSEGFSSWCQTLRLWTLTWGS